MNLDQLFKLIDAGFTKDDIMQFIQKPSSDQGGSDPDPAKDTVQNDKTEPEEKLEPEESATDKLLQGITGQLKNLTEAMQLQNIRNATGAGTKPETVEDIFQKMFDGAPVK